ncbi:DUF61 family protein [Thermococcus barophilus]|uniref:UPF0216 protein TERMP_01677 n=1 Tax=Thermococcus barophilus (strain DSM 11836 / MP) TaxID=391623 RepID=F0LJL0_THEBM|nr:DUF61 family protein [Thermococcus barophilus]ADT84652.1 hypothetical protein TERMP_01677 [Thermococcus barophilus MP]
MPQPDEIINKEIARINLHLPRARKSLAKLLNEDVPKVQLRDGSFHYFKKEELEYLQSLLDVEELEKLHLPIVLEITTAWHGYFRVRGKVEVKVIEKVLGTYDILEEKVEVTLPRYLLPKIRRTLPTTTTYAFIME